MPRRIDDSRAQIGLDRHVIAPVRSVQARLAQVDADDFDQRAMRYHER